MKEKKINYNYVSRSEEELLKLVIDCSTNEWLPTYKPHGRNRKNLQKLDICSTC